MLLIMPLNVLIAMLSQTFTEVAMFAHRNYAFGFAKVLVAQRSRPGMIAIPLNLFTIPYRTIKATLYVLRQLRQLTGHLTRHLMHALPSASSVNSVHTPTGRQPAPWSTCTQQGAPGNTGASGTRARAAGQIVEDVRLRILPELPAAPGSPPLRPQRSFPELAGSARGRSVSVSALGRDRSVTSDETAQKRPRLLSQGA